MIEEKAVETQIALHQQRLDQYGIEQEEIKKQLGGIFKKIDELKIAVLTRPSWFVATTITFLVGLVSAMSTYLILNR